MQGRWLAKLGRDLISSCRPSRLDLPSRCLASMALSVNLSVPKPVSARSRRNKPPDLGFYPISPLLPVGQARFYAAKERSRAPLTPVKSKVKKYKLKSYSSFKSRFRTMNDGQIRRWRAGKRHNAHLKIKKNQLLKSKSAKRRLRHPEIVHLAYAKVLKKLNFCG
ncbi:hypothetical protein ZIOFF_045516 [Zingiber officinale]|uniref:50S ribosomal protein L35 n=1 Tax=Zingiber officinale TaxID=94328 RepID=A0A8J5GD81_ZINOF|nr:hypothetical protein ZIOFF_045516 [Zingiber officinale]